MAGWEVALSLFPHPDKISPGGVTFQVKCSSMRLVVNVSGLEPAQAFPQPMLTVHFGAVSWSGIPTARLVQGRALLELEINPADNVMKSRATLKALADGVAPQIDFAGGTISGSGPPSTVGSTFAAECSRIWDFP